jgi:hypothetical protein
MPIGGGRMNELADLTPPEDLADEYEEWIVLTRSGIASYKVGLQDLGD